MFSSIMKDGTSAGPEGSGDLIREEFQLDPVDHLDGLVVKAPARRAGDQSLNPGPGEIFSLKLLMLDTCLEIATECQKA